MRDKGHRISEAALLIGYAMSRLDRSVLELLDCETWDGAFLKVANLLGENPRSIKAIRDEFDPYFVNTRRGWVDRPMRPPLIALLHEMEGVSDGALEALVSDAVGGRTIAVEAVREVLALPPDRLADVGQRLRTGAFAEAFFVENCHRLVDVAKTDLRDTRLDACGYDFGIQAHLTPVFEIKGLASSRGSLLFTDLEWQTARRLGTDYWLVVVSNIETNPRPTVINDPVAWLPAEMYAQQRLTVSWRATFSSVV